MGSDIAVSPQRIADVKEYTSELDVLCLDRNPDDLEKLGTFVSRLFRSAQLCQNVNDAIKTISSLSPDIIITELHFPEIEPSAFLQRLREVSGPIPVIILTEDILDSNSFVSAINIQVSVFLKKPLNAEELLSAISSVARQTFALKSRDKLRKQEIELLRYRSRYHSQQQELASRKEHHLLRNDIPGGMIEAGPASGRILWLVDVSHHPRDIMCGDAYMLRSLENGDILIFLVDSMGSGLSASLTSVCSTACLNFLTDLYLKEQRYDLDRLVTCFMTFCRTILLDDEVLSCGFIHLHLDSMMADTILFGLPPLLAKSTDDTVIKIRGNNGPITNLSDSYTIGNIDLNKLKGLLFCTDGITDAETEDGPYREKLPEDFSDTFFAHELIARLKEHSSTNSDDTTIVRLSRMEASSLNDYSLIIESPSLVDISKSVVWIETSCARIGAESSFIDELTMAAGEALMNAFEHGCLAIGETLKQELIAADRYDEMLGNSAEHASIRIDFEMMLVAGRRLLILKAEDSGNGFDVRRYFHNESNEYRFRGRGINIIRNYTDHLAYNRQGNRVYLMKYLDREDT